MGGEPHQCSTVRFQAGRWQAHFKTFLRTSRGVKCGAYCKVCWCGPTSFARLSRMPVEDLCRRFASPLFVPFIFIRRDSKCISKYLYAGGANAGTVRFSFIALHISREIFHVMGKKAQWRSAHPPQRTPTSGKLRRFPKNFSHAANHPPLFFSPSKSRPLIGACFFHFSDS